MKPDKLGERSADRSVRIDVSYCSKEKVTTLAQSQIMTLPFLWFSYNPINHPPSQGTDESYTNKNALF